MIVTVVFSPQMNPAPLRLGCSCHRCPRTLNPAAPLLFASEYFRLRVTATSHQSRPCEMRCGDFATVETAAVSSVSNVSLLKTGKIRIIAFRKIVFEKSVESYRFKSVLVTALSESYYGSLFNFQILLDRLTYQVLFVFYIFLQRVNSSTLILSWPFRTFHLQPFWRKPPSCASCGRAGPQGWERERWPEPVCE